MDDKPEQAEADTAASDQGADEDIRSKMKAALDRKHEHEHGGEPHLEGHDKAPGGPHGKSGGPRNFRRKTG